MAEMHAAEEESASDEVVLTPMQLAFEAARQQGQPAAPVKSAKTAAKRDDSEDIFARTIQQHRATNG
jgi:hypothetical protein